ELPLSGEPRRRKNQEQQTITTVEGPPCDQEKYCRSAVRHFAQKGSLRENMTVAKKRERAVRQKEYDILLKSWKEEILRWAIVDREERERGQQLLFSSTGVLAGSMVSGCGDFSFAHCPKMEGTIVMDFHSHDWPASR
ncbi:hypothetical protein HAX54_045708, partial [Datura stramonium]|nr:hypothetical protein [Datura stramonium]